MKKLKFGIIGIVIILAILASSSTVLADGYGLSTSSIWLIGSGKTLSVSNPFQVSCGFDTYLPEDGIFYPGENVATVNVTVTNVGRMPYGINIFPQVEKNNSDFYPNFSIATTGSGNPNQLPIVRPGEKVKFIVKISIGYGSRESSFEGLYLNIIPAPAEIPAIPGRG